MSGHILPDSRLRHETIGSQVVDWPLPDGQTVRCEAVQVFCANCGTPYGYVPRDNTNFAFWLCRKCYEVYGTIAGTYAEPDADFCERVGQEMLAAYGRHLSVEEIVALVDQGKLARPLELLARESPFPVPK